MLASTKQTKACAGRVEQLSKHKGDWVITGSFPIQSKVVLIEVSFQSPKRSRCPVAIGWWDEVGRGEFQEGNENELNFLYVHANFEFRAIAGDGHAGILSLRRVK